MFAEPELERELERERELRERLLLLRRGGCRRRLLLGSAC
jgi:hypothetical protein